MTHSIQQSVMFNVLRQVSPDRLQRAVNALVENSASVTLTRTTDTEIRALVRNGEGHEYGVTLTETGVFCSCRDALYRGQICKHATLLALTVFRTAPTTSEVLVRFTCSHATASRSVGYSILSTCGGGRTGRRPRGRRAVRNARQGVGS